VVGWNVLHAGLAIYGKNSAKALTVLSGAKMYKILRNMFFL